MKKPKNMSESDYMEIFVRIEADYRSFPKLPKLTHLCWFDELPSNTIDLSSVPALMYLSCFGNRLTELDIRGCLHLKSVTVDPWVVVHKRPDQTIEHPE